LQGRIMSTYSIESDSVVWETAPIYGINRLGMYNAELNLDMKDDEKDYITFYRGKKRYELSNHLGNVMTVISDRKVPESAGEGSVAFTADIVSAADYYAFGMAMPGRQYQNDYMYGFNAMERDDEIKGDGNSYDFGARLYDPRAGIWLSVDPLAYKFPHTSPYLAFAANPINFIDPDGREPKGSNDDMVFEPEEVAHIFDDDMIFEWYEVAHIFDDDMEFSVYETYWYQEEIANRHSRNLTFEDLELMNNVYSSSQLLEEVSNSIMDRRRINQLNLEHGREMRRIDSELNRAISNPQGQETTTRINELSRERIDLASGSSPQQQQIQQIRSTANTRRLVVKQIPLAGAGITTASMVNRIYQDALSWERGEINALQYFGRSAGNVTGGAIGVAVPFGDDVIYLIVDQVIPKNNQ